MNGRAGRAHPETDLHGGRAIGPLTDVQRLRAPGRVTNRGLGAAHDAAPDFGPLRPVVGNRDVGRRADGAAKPAAEAQLHVGAVGAVHHGRNGVVRRALAGGVVAADVVTEDVVVGRRGRGVRAGLAARRRAAGRVSHAGRALPCCAQLPACCRRKTVRERHGRRRRHDVELEVALGNVRRGRLAVSCGQDEVIVAHGGRRAGEQQVVALRRSGDARGQAGDGRVPGVRRGAVGGRDHLVVRRALCSRRQGRRSRDREAEVDEVILRLTVVVRRIAGVGACRVVVGAEAHAAVARSACGGRPLHDDGADGIGRRPENAFVGVVERAVVVEVDPGRHASLVAAADGDGDGVVDRRHHQGRGHGTVERVVGRAAGRAAVVQQHVRSLLDLNVRDVHAVRSAVRVGRVSVATQGRRLGPKGACAKGQQKRHRQLAAEVLHVSASSVDFPQFGQHVPWNGRASTPSGVPGFERQALRRSDFYALQRLPRAPMQSSVSTHTVRQNLTPAAEPAQNKGRR
ncbi:MAG: hypothetical protein HPKKFMNG_01394 [Planctomycetes bacterium]|nr:hypothetical protein [Planctomycetota bacterium]